MSIWIVFDDCPQEFGEKEIIRIFSSRQLAEYFVADKKIKKPYEHQYYVIQKHSVYSTVTMGGRT